MVRRDGYLYRRRRRDLLGKGRFVRLDHVDNPQMTAAARQKYFASCGGTGAKVGNDAKGQQDAIVQVHRFLVATLHEMTGAPSQKNNHSTKDARVSARKRANLISSSSSLW
jgi:hypothetical protein